MAAWVTYRDPMPEHATTPPHATASPTPDPSTPASSSTAHRAGESIEAHIGCLSTALAAVLAEPGAETIPVGSALGRLTADEVRAPAPLPGFDNSQMDGFALRSADTPGSLPVAAVIAAGSAPGVLAPGTCAPIMTGAPVPAGADAVVAVEATAASSFEVEVIEVAEVPRGRYVRRTGSDVAAGDVLVPAGTRLTAAGVGVLAASGFADVAVRTRPRVLVYTGGDEVVPPGTALGPGQVHDANGSIVTGRLSSLGLEVVRHSLIDDRPDGFAARLRADLAEHRPDLVVTSGGISQGRFEVVKQVLGALPEADVAFGGIAMQPGGPQGCGVIRGVDASGGTDPSGSATAAVVCLPGNPVSTWVSLEVLLAEALAAVWHTCPAPAWRPARLRTPITGVPGKTQIRRGALLPSGDGDLPSVEVFEGTSSHLLAHAARATALVRVPASDSPREADGSPGDVSGPGCTVDVLAL